MRDVGSLVQMRNLINAKQVCEDVKRNYYATENFFNKVTDALLRLGLEYMKRNKELTTSDSVQEYIDLVFADKLPTLPALTCKYCNKEFTRAVNLRKHEQKKHSSASNFETVEHNSHHSQRHTILLVKLLLLRKNLHEAIHYGDGERLVLTVKYMLPYFKVNNNYKYALACFELIAQTKFFLSPRMALNVTQGRFVNFRGKADSNYPIDLCLEHSNKTFKDNIALYRGECTQKILDLVSKSQTVTKAILDNFHSEFHRQVYVSQRRTNQEQYDQDVTLLYDFLSAYDIYEATNNQFTSSLEKASVDQILVLNIHELRDWMISTLSVMKTQSFLQI